jgi:4-hydroxy-tetrahydrodipicolinate synthase
MATSIKARGEKKEWALHHYKGIENSLKASFTPDFTSLDEEGIRHDVRQSIKNGFFSTMCSSTGITLAERKQFLEIVRSEVGDQMMTGANVAQPSLEESLDLLAHAEKLGCSHAFVSFPRKLQPQSEEEIYRYYRQITDATNMALVLYAFDSPALRGFDPSGIVTNVFDRLADVPNVVAMKLTQPINPATAFQLCERLADRILIGPASLDMVPLLGRHYQVQWSGQWIVEAVQSPDKPYAVEFMDLIHRRRFDEAMKIYWLLEPAYRLVHRLQAPLLVKGGHPWAHMRYFQWCVGGNGGLTRETGHSKDQVCVLDKAGRQEIIDTYRSIGIEPVCGPEDEFIVGRANYSKGIRPKDMASLPLYA